MGDVSTQAEQLGREAHGSEWMDWAVRAGLVAYGVVHLLIAWLAVQLALGDHSENASNKGAMQQLMEQPFGEFLVWAIAVGMFLLVIWRVLEACFGHQDVEGKKRWAKRASSLGKAVIYGAVGVTAVKVAIDARSGGGSTWTKDLMDVTGGQFLVGAIGLGVIGYGAYMAYRGLTEKYAEHLTAEGKSGEAGRAYLLFGKVGYVAKGSVIAIVGGLILYAAVTHDPKKSGGLDEALQTLLGYPFGQILLLIVAVGIGAYGLFCFARARHLSR